MKTFIVIFVLLVTSLYTASAAEGPEYVRTGTLQVEGQEGTQVPETVSYYKEENIVVYRKEDGTFEAAQDYDLALYYYRPVGEQLCYILLTPDTTPSDGKALEDSLSDHIKLELVGEAEDLKHLGYDEILTYTAFIPDYIKNECVEGFKYAVISDDSDTGGAMAKRHHQTIIMMHPR